VFTIVHDEKPVPEGIAHVPSPRQKVEDDAPVPLFKFATGRLPVTCEAKLTRPERTDAHAPPM
jgi:hypothetical protein